MTLTLTYNLKKIAFTFPCQVSLKIPYIYSIKQNDATRIQTFSYDFRHTKNTSLRSISSNLGSNKLISL
mgnify:CR=1 FL=1